MQHRGGDVFWLKHTDACSGLSELVFAVFKVVIEKWSIYKAGGDGSDTGRATVSPKFITQGITNAAHGKLGGGVESARGRHTMAAHAGGVDDLATGFRKQSEGFLAANGERLHVELPHGFPIGGVAIRNA